MLKRGTAAVQGQGVGLGGGHFGLYAGQVQLGHVTGAEAAFGQRQGALVRTQGFTHQRTLGVQRAQRQVGLGHVGLHQQAGALQQGVTRLGVQACGVAGAGQAAKQIQLVRQAHVGVHQRGGAAAAGAVGPGLARGTTGQTKLWRTVGLGVLQQRLGLGQAGGGFGDAGVVLAGAFDQCVQRRVVKRLPPGAPVTRFGRGGQRPLHAGNRGFLEGSGGGGNGHRVHRRGGGATGQHQGREQRCEGLEMVHGVSLWAGVIPAGHVAQR